MCLTDVLVPLIAAQVYNLLGIEPRRNLRRACRAARAALDPHVRRLQLGEVGRQPLSMGEGLAALAHLQKHLWTPEHIDLRGMELGEGGDRLLAAKLELELEQSVVASVKTLMLPMGAQMATLEVCVSVQSSSAIRHLPVNCHLNNAALRDCCCRRWCARCLPWLPCTCQGAQQACCLP